MNHQEEKEQELESLSFIYIEDELEIIDSSNLIIRLKPDDPDVENLQDDWLVEINFKLPENYPESIPVLEISSNLMSEIQIDELVDRASNQCQDSVGDAMIFTIASWIKEEAEMMIKKRVEEEEAIKILEMERLELEEKAKYQGTKVTTESFLNWQKGFVKEARLSLKQHGNNLDKVSVAFRAALAIEDAIQASTKLTGKQLFERDLKLVQSDVQFGEEGETVEVDTKTLRERQQAEVDTENEVLRNFTED